MSRSNFIFICYRREESSGHAGRLYDHLSAHFSPGQIFMDIDMIEPGLDFAEVIRNAVSSCDAMIVVIGRQWQSLTDAEGRVRLHNPDDFVHMEISTALERKIRVIPVLVQGATMPRPTDLTEPLAGLSGKQALNLSNERLWKHDIRTLINLLEGLGIAPVEGPPEEQKQPEEAGPTEEEEQPEDFHIITSPLVGTFYRSPSPTSNDFVRVGSRIEPDTVVCIIEAMKLMNEIQAETTGAVKEIYVHNGYPVEYGQPLFKVGRPDTDDVPEPEASPDEVEVIFVPPKDLHVIYSPIVGTFYRAYPTDTKPFVRVGSHVEVWTVVCIVEAMQLMNEIEADVTGTIEQIYIENGQPVEFNQPLFGVRLPVADGAQFDSPAGTNATTTPAEPVEETYMIPSPLIGLFYRAPWPGAESFVQVGSRVGPETVVCVIESMKLMNEVLAEVAGTVKQIFVEDGKLVEYGEPLFEITRERAPNA
jgi:acetyl-CoA carboxylase biotin carboxyl carrier protein